MCDKTDVEMHNTFKSTVFPFTKAKMPDKMF